MGSLSEDYAVYHGMYATLDGIYIENLISYLYKDFWLQKCKLYIENLKQQFVRGLTR